MILLLLLRVGPGLNTFPSKKGRPGLAKPGWPTGQDKSPSGAVGVRRHSSGSPNPHLI